MVVEWDWEIVPGTSPHVERETGIKLAESSHVRPGPPTNNLSSNTANTYGFRAAAVALNYQLLLLSQCAFSRGLEELPTGTN